MDAEQRLIELRGKIVNLIPTINKKPYSHNLIGLYLAEVAENYGRHEANKIIIDFHLNKKGWSIVE